MPLYRFICTACHSPLEQVHRFDEPHPTTCKCGGRLRHIFNVPNVTYHGSGFYTTDKVLYDVQDDD